MAITLVVTDVSYRFIETPVRKGKLSAWLRTWRGAKTRERMAHRRRMVAMGVVLAGLPIFAIAKLSTAEVKLDAISQSLVDADGFVTNVLPTIPPDILSSTSPSTTPTGTSVFSTTTTIAVEKIDILAIGDSVMLGAALELTKFGVTVDAQKSRSFKAALPIVNYVKSINAFGSAVVVHLGTNSGTSQETINSIFDVLVGVPKVVVLTNNVPRKGWESLNNRLIRALPERYPNVVVLDWKKIAGANPTWLYADKTHLRPIGQRKYTSLVMEALGRNGPQFEDAILTAPGGAITTSSMVAATTSTPSTSVVAPSSPP